jgi:hypothetical protein
MLYDYIVESYLVIEYVDDKNRNSMLTTNCERKYYYLDNSSEQNKEVKNILLKRKLEETTRKKMMFENNEWIKCSYKKCYKKIWYININKLLKVYKVYKAFENQNLFYLKA